MRVAVGESLDELLVDRRRGPALAGDLRRDSLIDLRRQARIDEDRQLGLAEHVDEPGRDDLSVRVDGAITCLRGEAADRGDAPVTDADVAGVPRRSRTVDDAAVADDDV